MAEDKIDSTNPLPFEEYVRQTLSVVVRQQAVMLDGQNKLQLQQNLLQQQQSELKQQQNELRQEMAERFLQLSRQIRDLDQKVDVYIREHTYIKDDVRELRAKMNLQ